MSRSAEIPDDTYWYQLALKEANQIPLFSGNEMEIAQKVQEIIHSMTAAAAPKDAETWVLSFGRKKVICYIDYIYRDNKLVQITSGSRIENVPGKEAVRDQTTVIYLAAKIIM